MSPLIAEDHASMALWMRSRAAATPDETAYRLWNGTRFEPVDWRKFWANACTIASGLRAAGVRPGDRVLFLVPETGNAIACQFGAWVLGATPAHVGLPYRLSDPSRFVDELRQTAARLRVRAVVVDGSLARHATIGDDEVPLLTTDALLSCAVEDTDVPPRIEAPALLQLTSGSTGRARGILISHEKLLRHLRAISEALPADPRCIGVSWLPLYHDMGLIGGLLYPLFNGFVIHLLSPLHFRSQPMLWLRSLDAVRATHTVGPPSAYAIACRLATRAHEEKLDLSALTCAMIGAEPIAPRLLGRFTEAFAPCGFRRQAWFPVYGLAEATVAVSFPIPGSSPRIDRIARRKLEDAGRAEPADPGEIELVSVGKPLPDTRVRIVDDRGAELPERHVGEVEISSPTLMDGYAEDLEATSATFRDGWLMTGDLGYVAGGDLFITARKKELIIRGGKNFIPAVLEEIVSGVPGVRAGCVAAVGVKVPDRHTELIGILVETRLASNEWERLADEIRLALERNGIEADRVKVVASGELPKTSSGKIRRIDAAKRFDG